MVTFEYATLVASAVVLGTTLASGIAVTGFAAVRLALKRRWTDAALLGFGALAALGLFLLWLSMTPYVLRTAG